MRAVLCSAFTGPEDLRIGEIEEPKPASDEILIDVHAASVSFMDHLLVSGRYQMRPSTPFVPGTEAAGVVIAVGGVFFFLLADQRLPVGHRDLVVIGMDFREGEEAVTVPAVIDERRLQRRLDPRNLG